MVPLVAWLLGTLVLSSKPDLNWSVPPGPPEVGVGEGTNVGVGEKTIVGVEVGVKVGDGEGEEE